LVPCGQVIATSGAIAIVGSDSASVEAIGAALADADGAGADVDADVDVAGIVDVVVAVVIVDEGSGDGARAGGDSAPPHAIPTTAPTAPHPARLRMRAKLSDRDAHRATVPRSTKP
jgi:hypothetical protein